jgi:(heptosyl)LPS beta-1,4-glucosyltransferase
MASAPKITAVLITKNEEKNVRDCLDSVRWCDEIVLVDSLSADRTCEIGREFTDKVIGRPWPGICGAQRNVGLDAASGDWVLMIDADERITPELREELLSFSKAPGRYAGALIPRKNYFFGRWMRHGGCYPDRQMRFFLRDRCRYNEETGKGFDTPFLDGEPKPLDAPMLHYTGQTIADRIRKTGFDADLQAREKFRRSRKAVGAADLLFRPMAAFFKTFVSQGGWKDGIEGFIFAVLSAFHNFAKYAMVRELQQARPGAETAGR